MYGMKLWWTASLITLTSACAAGPTVAPGPVAESAPLPADHNGPPEIPAPALAISSERMNEIARTLASDPFQGRAPGTEGEGRTVDYLVEQFKQAGLEPGGENGGWTQSVPMIRTQLEGTRIGITQKGQRRNLSVPDDIYVTTVRPVDRARIAGAPMVFVGYGVSAPERGWDDFKGVDLKNKVAVFLVNDPDFAAARGDDAAGKFGGKAMTYYGRWSYKFEEAARRGAIAALVIHETEAAGYGWNVAGGGGGENYALADNAGPTPPMLQGWIQGPVFESIVKAAGLNATTLMRRARFKDFRPVDLRARLSADASVKVDRIASRNVIGKLTGRTRPEETVSYGGHWDAYGVGKPDANGLTIRPGAADDAVGLAAMIEVARLFAAGPRTDRSLIFAAWTGEERGLLGSEYYAQHPLYPMSKMAANLTFDTLQWAGPVKDVVLIGKGQSDLETIMADEASKQGRTVTDESHPERGLFYRADHFSFAKRGVPVLLNMALAGEYELVEGGRAAGAKWLSDFTTTCYHQTCDAWTPAWDLRGAVQEAELFRQIGLRLANGGEWPAWREGSEFAKVRAESAAERK